MEGIGFYQHKINLKEGAMSTVRQQRYQMNPNYTKQVKEEIDRVLRVGFIYHPMMEKASWISPIVIVPKEEHENQGMCELQET